MSGGTPGLRVALLTNFIAPYRLPLFLALTARLSALRILVSTRMEANRTWEADFGGLNVQVQQNLTLKLPWKHPSGFRETLYTHFPYDTLWQLRAFRPDVIVSGEFGFRTLNALLYRLLFRRARLVIWATISEASEEQRSGLRRAVRHLLIRLADAIMTNGRSGIRYLEGFHSDPRKLFIVPQTVNVEAFAAVPLSREGEAARRLLFVGQLVARKGVAPFLEILADWCQAKPEVQVEFWAAGEGPERVAIEKVNLPGNLGVRLLGNVDYAALASVYRQAGILVLPTFADEWGLVVNEGLAAGLPVLGSQYAQAVQEIVEEGRTGWTYRIDRPDEVRLALDRVFGTSDQKLNEMRAAARETAFRLTPEAVAARMMATIQFARGSK